MKKRLLIIVLVIIGFYAVEASGADWKFFGGTVLEKGDKVIVYYDAESVEYPSDGNVRVWTKTVAPSEVEKVIEKKEVIEKAAQKVANGYYPPYILTNPTPQPSFDNYMEIIGWEEAANHGETQPRARIFFEMNCKIKMIRSLSAISFGNDGGIKSSKRTPDEWSYISPETDSDTLHKILCKGRRSGKR